MPDQIRLKLVPPIIISLPVETLVSNGPYSVLYFLAKYIDSSFNFNLILLRCSFSLSVAEDKSLLPL